MAAAVGVECAPVLAVDEQQVDAHGRRRLLEDVAERDEQAHARRAVVGAEDRPRLVAEIGIVVRLGARVPVRHVEHALRRGGVESGEDVLERQLGAVGRRLRPTLHGHAVRALLHLRDDPRGGRVVRRRAGRPRTERQVRLHVAERGLTVERGLRAAEAAVAPAQQENRGTEKADHAHGKVSSGIDCTLVELVIRRSTWRRRRIGIATRWTARSARSAG